MKDRGFVRREFLMGTGWLLGAALAGGCAVGRKPGEAWSGKGHAWFHEKTAKPVEIGSVDLDRMGYGRNVAAAET